MTDGGRPGYGRCSVESVAGLSAATGGVERPAQAQAGHPGMPLPPHSAWMLGEQQRTGLARGTALVRSAGWTDAMRRWHVVHGTELCEGGAGHRASPSGRRRTHCYGECGVPWRSQRTAAKHTHTPPACITMPCARGHLWLGIPRTKASAAALLPRDGGNERHSIHTEPGFHVGAKGPCTRPQRGRLVAACLAAGLSSSRQLQHRTRVPNAVLWREKPYHHRATLAGAHS